jgi:two-component system, cell cycle sensor histidine kinase and response regulator CckA
MAAFRLLIVDDEATLLDLLRRYLERLGYQAETFTDPTAALASFESDPQRFAMVISDLTLPGMDGEELIDRIRGIHPTIPALISSGRSYQPRLADVAFLQKPFLPKMLIEEVEKLLKR